MLKRLTIAALLASSLLGAPPVAQAATPVDLATTPISRLDLPWWKQRFDQSLARTRQGHVGLIWLGDSITENWELAMPAPYADFVPVWKRFYGDRQAVNMGFSGDTTASVIWRIDHGEVDGLSPRAVVLLIGANNFGRVHWSAAQTLAGIKTITERLHRKLPETKILVLGVLPSRRGAWVDQQTAAVNRDLAQAFVGSPYVSFMDVGHVLLRDGAVDESLYLDPKFYKLSAAMLIPLHPEVRHMAVPGILLHPDAFGMERIAAAIEPRLHQMMGDRNHMKAEPVQASVR